MANSFEDDWIDFSKRIQGLFEHYSKLPTDEKALVSKTSLNLSQMINDPGIPYTVRQAILREAKEKLKVHSNTGAYNFIGRGESADVYRFLSRDLDPTTAEGAIRAGISIQHDPTKKAFHALDQFRVSANLPSAKWVEHMKAQKGILSSLNDASKLFVFDTETVGLSNTLAGVHEVSGSTFTFGGGFRMTDTVDANFSPPRLSYGRIWNGHRKDYLTINEHLGKVGAVSQTEGDEFLKSLYPVLKRMDTSNVIAGQNVRFDIEQVLQNAMRTKGYQDGTMTVGGDNIRQLIDRIWATKIDTPGALLDTQEVAKTYFGFDGRKMISVAPELQVSKQLRPMSLENMILSTNLTDLMEADNVNIEDFFLNQTGHHSATFDNQLTAYYLKYMKEDRLRAGVGVGRESGHGIIHKRIRQRVLASHAYTPTVNISDAGEISPRLFSRMVDEGEVKVGILGDSGGISIHEGRGYKGLTAGKLREVLMNDRRPEFFIGNVNPLEQAVFMGREAIKQTRPSTVVRAGSTQDILPVANIWKHFSGMATPYEGMLNATGGLSKIGGILTDAEFSGVQDIWHKVGMPFADLTREERILTGALGQAATKTSAVRSSLEAMPGQRLVADDLADLGMLHFSLHEKSRIAPTGKVSLPVEVLNQAANDNSLLSNLAMAEEQKIVNGEIKWLNMSAIPANADHGRIGFNVGMDISQDQSQELATWLRGLSDDATLGGKTLEDLGLEGSKRFDIATAIEDSGAKWGVNVGYLDGEAGRFASGALDDILQSVIRDSDKVNFMLPYLGHQDGVMMTGPSILNRWMNKGERGTVGRNLNKLRALANRLQGDILQDPELMKQLPDIQGRADREVTKAIVDNADAGLDRSKVVADAATKGMDDGLAQAAWHSKLMKHHLPLGVLAVAGLTLGAIGFKKYRDNKFYGETREQMPTEGRVASPAAMEIQASVDQYGYGLPPRRMDPLATAGVVGNMDTNRTNHTMMGTNKNSSLYSGVY